MTEQIALDNLKKLEKRWLEDENMFSDTMDIAIDEEFMQSIYKAEKALEKQIPKEIKQEINGGRFERYCPNSCQITGVTMYVNIKYCPYCGQAIK